MTNCVDISMFTLPPGRESPAREHYVPLMEPLEPDAPAPDELDLPSFTKDTQIIEADGPP
jgi:hypothetical protein